VDSLTLFGLFAVASMMICYALESRSHWFVLAFAEPAYWLPPTASCKVRGRSASSKRSGRWSRCGAGWAGGPHDPRIGDHLSAMRPSGRGADAQRRLPILLSLQGLRRTAQAEGGRLLRVLFLWVGAVSAGATKSLLRLT
jgi:hypothetical protein